VLRALGIGLMLSAGCSTSASAILFCSKPTEPSCIDRFGTFSDEWSFNRCKSEVESYMSDATSYRSCLINEINSVKSEVDTVVERFNCKAKGGTFCR
jgi:hypothetical protein